MANQQEIDSFNLIVDNFITIATEYRTTKLKLEQLEQEYKQARQYLSKGLETQGYADILLERLKNER